MTVTPNDLSLIVACCVGEADDRSAADLEARAAESPELRSALEGVRAMLRTLETDDSVDPPAAVLRRAQGLFAARSSPTAAPGPAAAFATGLREFVARLVHQSGEGVLLAGLRGGGGERHLVFESELGEIDVRIEPLASGSGRRLLGQVGIGRTGVAPRVLLARADAASAVIALAVDEAGVFTAAVTPGRYRVRVESGDTAVDLPEFDA